MQETRSMTDLRSRRTKYLRPSYRKTHTENAPPHSQPKAKNILSCLKPPALAGIESYKGTGAHPPMQKPEKIPQKNKVSNIIITPQSTNPVLGRYKLVRTHTFRNNNKFHHNTEQ